jgi:hypothetical protein
MEWAWRPQAGPQHALVLCPAKEIFFGGTRGGGKTDGVLGKWAQLGVQCHYVPQDDRTQAALPPQENRPKPWRARRDSNPRPPDSKKAAHGFPGRSPRVAEASGRFPSVATTLRSYCHR